MYRKGNILDKNLIHCMNKLSDEESNKLKFRAIRNEEGVTCRHCGGKDHYWQKTIWMYECKKCKTRTTLRSGTVMQASKLPFRFWFITMHMLTSTKKPFSSLELQRQLGHKFYEPIWYMIQKLRKKMGIRDGEFQLDKIVELDDGFFEDIDTELSKEEKPIKLKHGRGSQKQSKVIVMASTVHTLNAPKKHKKQTKFRYVKMLVVDNLKSATIQEKVEQNIQKGSLVKSDNYKGYTNIKELVWSHQPKTVKPKEAAKVLPWVHTMISNAKRNLLGIHHMFSKRYHQDYLDMFCCKVNRRYMGDLLFDRLLFACASNNYKKFIHVS